MYTPAHYAQSDQQLILRLIQEFPLGAVTYLLDEAVVPRIEHMPFEIEDQSDRWILRAHMARRNPATSEMNGKSAVVVFTGPSVYISPSWYPSKRENGLQVPTWNYAAVHVHGRAKVIDDRIWVRQFLDRLTSRHETGRPNAWSIDDSPQDYIDAMLSAVVGLELEVSAVEAKWKLGQNKTSTDLAGAVQGLRDEAARQPLAALTALWMEETHERK